MTREEELRIIKTYYPEANTCIMGIHAYYMWLKDIISVEVDRVTNGD